METQLRDLYSLTHSCTIPALIVKLTRSRCSEAFRRGVTESPYVIIEFSNAALQQQACISKIRTPNAKSQSPEPERERERETERETGSERGSERVREMRDERR